jgi:hypothetical protein
MKALCCLYGFLLEGFIRSRLVSRLHTVLVTIPGRNCFYGVCCVILEPPLGHCISFFTWSWARFISLVSAQLVMVAIMPIIFLRVGCYYLSSAFISALFSFWGKPRGLCPACSRCYYWPVRSLCSSVHNLSYRV